MKLIGKLFIEGYIEARTGLHIGGAKTALDIGGLDLSVIKDAAGVPFIPGSSLKGNLRAVLAREVGSPKVDEDPEPIRTIFGYTTKEEGHRARLIVRDAPMDVEDFQKKKEQAFQLLDFPYTQVKWENSIDRTKGRAQHPRQIERVPAGTRFTFQLVYSLFDDGKAEEHIRTIRKAMRLIEDDYIGGHGTRGYGRIAFREVRLLHKAIRDYETENRAHLLVADFMGASEEELRDNLPNVAPHEGPAA